MKKAFKILALLIVVGVVAIQFFRVDTTNPPIAANETLEAAVVVSPDIAGIIGRSCNDCHSNATRYPWYTSLQPSAWFMKDHIDSGRTHLNFSIFNTYPASKKVKKLEQICEEVESHDMPLPSYLWIHRDAILSESDGKALCDWANQEKGKIAAD